jgi:hypothetical protein
MGPRTWPVHQDIEMQVESTRLKQTHVETDASHFVKTEEMQVHGTRLWC